VFSTQENNQLRRGGGEGLGVHPGLFKSIFRGKKAESHSREGKGNAQNCKEEV